MLDDLVRILIGRFASTSSFPLQVHYLLLFLEIQNTITTISNFPSHHNNMSNPGFQFGAGANNNFSFGVPGVQEGWGFGVSPEYHPRNTAAPATQEPPREPTKFDEAEPTDMDGWRRKYARLKAEDDKVIADHTLTIAFLKEKGFARSQVYAAAKSITDLKNEVTVLQHERTAFEDQKKAFATVKMAHEDSNRAFKEGVRAEVKQEVQADYHDSMVSLEAEKTDLQNTVDALRNELFRIRDHSSNTTDQLDKSIKALADSNGERELLQTSFDNLQAEVTRQTERANTAEKHTDTIYADYEQAKAELSAATGAQDEALNKLAAAESQIEELRQQWEQEQSEKAEEARAWEEQVDGIQNDITKYHDTVQEQKRVITVYEERIHYLEGENDHLKRQLDATAAEAEDAAASSTEPFGESLETELSMSDYHEPPNEYSEITEIIDFAPIEPAPATQSAITEIIAYAPIEPTAAPASTTTAVYEVASVAPIAPVAPAHASLSLTNVREAASVAPVAPVPASLSQVVAQEIVNIAPVEPIPASLSLAEVHEAASVAPVEPALASLSQVAVQEVANIAPVEPIPASLSPVPVYEVGIHEVASLAPVQTQAPILNLNIAEAASVTSIARQNPTTASTQTEVSELAIQMLPTTLDVAPVAPTETRAAEGATRNTREFFDFDMEPESVEREPATSSSTGSSIGITLNEPQTAESKSTTTVATQTMPSRLINNIVPIKVTHEVQPIDQVSQLPPKTKHAVQTINSKKSTLLSALNITAFLILLLSFLITYMELHSWRTANGLGFSNEYDSNGAYGNGRVISIGESNTWFSEQIVRRFEHWAGVSYAPHY
jgi:predicted  nucleic acid-binding Zn-ribbon protein